MYTLIILHPTSNISREITAQTKQQALNDKGRILSQKSPVGNIIPETL